MNLPWKSATAVADSAAFDYHYDKLQLEGESEHTSQDGDWGES